MPEPSLARRYLAGVTEAMSDRDLIPQMQYWLEGGRLDSVKEFQGTPRLS